MSTYSSQAPDGTKNIPVGKTIALLAEEGDDISNLEAPADEPAPSAQPSQPTSTPQASSSASSQPPPAAAKTTSAPPSSHHEIPKTARPLFPSVLRLIQEHGITQADVDKIKGTGVRGMLTKGDVLTYLGLASAPLGTFHETPAPDSKTDAKTGAKAEKKEQPAVLDGAAVRRLIVGNMLEASIKARAAAGKLYPSTYVVGCVLKSWLAAVPKEPADFDSIIADSLPPAPKKSSPPAAELPSTSQPKSASYLDGLV